MSLDEWVSTAPRVLRDSPLWKVRVYQIGLYLSDLAMEDAARAANDFRLRETIPQFVKAVGSIAANVSEGYGRRSRAERIRYYEYALNSAAESQSWYMGARPTLGEAVVIDRLEYLARSRQLLLVMINNERKGGIWGSSRRIPERPAEPPAESPSPREG